MSLPSPDDIFSVTGSEFPHLALDIFRYQYAENQFYRAFVDQLGVNPESVDRIERIPFLPIGFFKTEEIRSGSFEPEIIFESSGTSQTRPSRHLVKDLSLYRASFRKGFEIFYGPVHGQCIIGLLPAYLERSGSSLVLMVDDLIRQSEDPQSGFYLREYAKLYELLRGLEAAGRRSLLIGVTFALLDFAEQFSLPLRHGIIMETGGMKGRGRELTRAELQDRLANRFGVKQVHSEYGMTELLSQAYSVADGLFQPVPWMRVLVRNEDDPLEVQPAGTGVLNIIDLANIHSCSFIATDDVGKVLPDGRFEVLGRLDSSDLRGCSLLTV